MRSIRLILVPALLLFSACTGDLQPIRPVDLFEVPMSAVPQGEHPKIAPGYVADVTSHEVWTVHGSLTDLGHLSDRDHETSAVTPPELGNQQWLLVDLGRPCRFQGVRQVHAPGDGIPRRYRIDLAGPKGYPWKLGFVGAGNADVSEAVFRKPFEARFFRITVIDEGPVRWGVAELELF